MKMRRKQSNLGWMVAAGAIALLSSSTVRNKLRQWAMKGTTAVIGASEKIKSRSEDQQKVQPFEFSPGNPDVNIPSLVESTEKTLERENNL
jgi:hypothetical protein